MKLRHLAIGLVISAAAPVLAQTSPILSPVKVAGPQNRTVSVGNSRYRVKVREDGSVIVVSKAILVGRTMQMRDGMREAVTVATGCKLIDELWVENALQGRLACS